MRFKYYLLLLLFPAYTASAQMVISPGAQLSLNGMMLTLENTDFINNGSFLQGAGITIFSGNSSSFIGGDQPLQFPRMNIRKTNNASVILQKQIIVPISLSFTSGFLNMNGFDIDLSSTGRLESESESSHITGPNGGQVIFNTVLTAPASENPGNLGAVITSSKSLGNVIIKRGHQSQNGGIRRYYDILPTENTNLDAELTINYLDGELNGLEETSLGFFKSEDGVNWVDQGFTTRNTQNNFVTKNGINSFSRWTLSNSGAALPVHFILFNAKCEKASVEVTWKTSQEQNSSHFDIERSVDGVRWSVIGSLPAAHNSNVEKTYSFTDNNPTQDNFYRIAEYDMGGRVQYTGIIRSSCNTTETFNLWPNPVHDNVFISIVSGTASQGTIRLFDSKGSLIKIQKINVLQGSNQFSLDMRSLPGGAYLLSAEWNKGQMKKALQVMKRE